MIKTYYPSGAVREFTRFQAVAQRGDFILGIAFEKGRRIPTGIYGYFQNENNGSILMLAKAWGRKKEWHEERDEFLKNFHEINESGIELARKNYKYYLNKKKSSK